MTEFMNIANADDAGQFYQALAAEYDAMTAFGQRLEREAPAIEELVREWQLRTVTDAGCGTGLHAILLARSGAVVIGTDPSAAMLAEARRQAAAAGVVVDWREQSLQQLAAGDQDAVFCLGNTIAHLLDTAALTAGLAAAHRALRPGGRIVLQLLNYPPLFAAHRRVIGARRVADVEYIRFYDFLDDSRLRFNILCLRWHGDVARPQLISTALRGWGAAELQAALATVGLVDCQLYANLQRQAFAAADSTNVVIVAQKPA